jgi:ADP-ribose pyrophosphatase YjhB (NUDIX family)
MNFFTALEEIRGIAQNGLIYCNNEHDRLKYSRLLEIAIAQYSELLDLDIEIIRDLFLKNTGIITPKVGVNAAVFKEGKLLICLRKDDNCWEVPGGWAELSESPRNTIIRELMEETSLNIKPEQVIEVFSRKPGDFGQPFTSFHILYFAKYVSGEFLESNETKDFQWITKEDLETIKWHRDHKAFAEAAFVLNA